MINLFARGAALLSKQLKGYASVSVTYRRGAQSVVLSAAVGSTTAEIDDAQGFRDEFKARDFIITSADLKLDGVVVEPRRGDLIEEANGRVYRVYPPGKAAGANQTSEPLFKYMDDTYVLMRVHTKLVTKP